MQIHRMFRWMALAMVVGLSAAAGAQTASSVSVNSFPNPSTYGQIVTLTATVTSGATGKVTFYDGTTVLGVGTVSAGSASISTILLPPGASSLHARYSGDSTYAASNSSPVAQSVLEGSSLGLQPAVSYSSGYYPAPLVVADFNGDGKADLAVASHGTTNVDILLGNGDGTFQAPVSYSSGGGTPASLAAGDWNGDGKVDLAVAINGYVIYVLLGNGDGTFQASTAVCSPCGGTWLASGDFNGDGKTDLVASVSSGSGAAAIVLLGNGDGTFQSPVKYSTPVNGGSFVAVGDINGDGNADFAVLYAPDVYVFLGKGDGTFGAAISSAVGTPASGLALADLDGDQKLDLVTGTTYSPGYISTALGNGDGTFQSVVTSATGVQEAQNLAVADVNGDGRPDVVASSQYAAQLYVFLGNGDGSLQSPAPYTIASQSYGVALADFNNDGRVDVAASVATTTGQVSILLGGAIPDLTVALSHGNGFTQGQVGATYKAVVTNIGAIASSGAVGLTISLPSGFSATAISGGGWTCVLVSVTCTRSDSLAANSSYPAVTVTVNVSNTPGSVTAEATVSGGNDGNPSNNTATDTTNVRYATTVSLNSSPDPSTLGQAVTLTATVGDGTGNVTFYDGTTVLGIATIVGNQATCTTSLLASGSRALTARYDGDSNYGPVLSAVRIQTVNAVSANGALPRTSYAVGSNVDAYAVAVADVNNDGKPDIVASTSSGISVLLGNGDGTFQPAASAVQNTSGPYGLAVGDMNGDGKADVVFFSSSTTVSLALGNGDGTFQTATSIGNSSSAFSQNGVAVGDFNRDGFADVLVTTGQGVTFYAGNGDGTFQPAALTAITGGVGAPLTSMVDMNGGGILDIAASNGSDPSSVFVYLGVGDGTFQSTPISHSSPAAYPDAATAADFNGDGKPDIVQLYWVATETFLGNCLRDSKARAARRHLRSRRRRRAPAHRSRFSQLH